MMIRVPTLKRWQVIWYNVVGDVIHAERFWTRRGAERRRQALAPPRWLPNLYASLVEKVEA